MAAKVKKNFMLLWSEIIALCICLLGAFTLTKVAVGAPSNTLEASREIDQTETSDSVPSSRVTIARVQSVGQTIVQEEASQNKASGPTPPPIPKSGGRIKKGRNLDVSSSPDKSEMRQGRGSRVSQDDDSLSPGSGSKGKSSKGKSSAGKEDSFN